MKTTTSFQTSPQSEVQRLLAMLETDTPIAPVATYKGDWAVSITDRKPCAWEPRSELLSFTFSYRGGPDESLVDVPLDKGITLDGVNQWLASSPSQLARLPGDPDGGERSPERHRC